MQHFLKKFGGKFLSLGDSCTKDFVRKKSTKVGGFQGISEIAIFRQ
jgi:hypothetical protein